MGKITKKSVIESRESIWEYNPRAKDNSVNGAPDIVATLRTLVTKVRPCLSFYHRLSADIAASVRARPLALHRSQAIVRVRTEAAMSAHGHLGPSHYIYQSALALTFALRSETPLQHTWFCLRCGGVSKCCSFPSILMLDFATDPGVWPEEAGVPPLPD